MHRARGPSLPTHPTQLGRVMTSGAPGTAHSIPSGVVNGGNERRAENTTTAEVPLRSVLVVAPRQSRGRILHTLVEEGASEMGAQLRMSCMSSIGTALMMSPFGLQSFPPPSPPSLHLEQMKISHSVTIDTRHRCAPGGCCCPSRPPTLRNLSTLRN